MASTTCAARTPHAHHLVALFTAGLLWGLGSTAAPAAQTAPQPGAAAGPGASPPGTTLPAIAESQAEWKRAMEQLPAPAKGCFASAFPRVEWKAVPCVTAPKRPYPPAIGRRPQTVGGSNDFAAEVTGIISSAVGSFDTVSGVTSETGQENGSGPQVANTYSLQLNTKPFTTSVC